MLNEQSNRSGGSGRIAEQEVPLAHVKATIRQLMYNFSMEVTTAEARRVESFRAHVRQGTEIYIAATPSTLPQDVIHLARRLSAEGLNPVPHVVARAIADVAAFDRWLNRLVREAGVRAILIVAGGQKGAPLGPYASSLEVIREGFLSHHGIKDVRFAGHPEGHSHMDGKSQIEALQEKQGEAERLGIRASLVTQFFFAAEPFIRWEMDLQRQNINMPVRIGLHGLSSMADLVRHAVQCGVGPSFQFLMQRRANWRGLSHMTAPDQLMHNLIMTSTDFAIKRITGCHFFPFGNLPGTAAWANAVVEGRFTIAPDGVFTIDETTRGA
jgi:methylenetetrahydrofolate reductase (NADPH)